MACTYKDALQTEPNLRDGYGLLKAFRTINEILGYAFELSQTCNRMLSRQRERQQLLELDDHLLEDIGLTRAEARHAGRKWFWQ
jgi:uncharacterized protein YjiS (DUF1127 family)